MPALTAANVAVTALGRTRVYAQQRQRLVRFVFGDGALTYPELGVPLPSASALGLRTLSHLQIIGDVSTPGTKWYYDYANSTLRAEAADVELTTAATPAATTLVCIAAGT